MCSLLKKSPARVSPIKAEQSEKSVLVELGSGKPGDHEFFQTIIRDFKGEDEVATRNRQGSGRGSFCEYNNWQDIRYRDGLGIGNRKQAALVIGDGDRGSVGEGACIGVGNGINAGGPSSDREGITYQICAFRAEGIRVDEGGDGDNLSDGIVGDGEGVIKRATGFGAGGGGDGLDKIPRTMLVTEMLSESVSVAGLPSLSVTVTEAVLL